MDVTLLNIRCINLEEVISGNLVLFVSTQHQMEKNIILWVYLF